jgi:hypothetical protein
MWCRKERSEQNFKEIENIKNVCLGGRVIHFLYTSHKFLFYMKTYHPIR